MRVSQQSVEGQIENEADRLPPPPLRRIVFSARSPHGGPVSPAVLSQALGIVNDSHSEAVLYDGLVAIAAMAGSTLDTPTGQTLFNDMLISTDRINDPWNRVDALSTLAKAMVEIAPESGF